MHGVLNHVHEAGLNIRWICETLRKNRLAEAARAYEFSSLSGNVLRSATKNDSPLDRVKPVLLPVYRGNKMEMSLLTKVIRSAGCHDVALGGRGLRRAGDLLCG